MDNPNQIADEIADLVTSSAENLTIKMEMKTSTGKVITEYFELSSGRDCWIVERGDVLS